MLCLEDITTASVGVTRGAATPRACGISPSTRIAPPPRKAPAAGICSTSLSLALVALQACRHRSFYGHVMPLKHRKPGRQFM